MNFGGQMFPWKSAAVIVPLVLTVVLVIALFFIEARVAEPMMPPRLFKNRSIACNLAANWFFGMTFCSFIYYLPIYFQVVRGDTAMWSGIRLIPMQMIICVSSTLAGIFISKRGIYRPLLPIGMALVTLSTGLLSLFGKYTSWSTVYGFTIIGGAGFGFVFSSAIIALQASSEPKDIAVVTGLGNFVRILGEALGIAISSAVLNSSLSQDLPAIVPEDIASKIIDSSEYVRNGCPPEYVDGVLNVYLDAIRLIWYVMIGMSLIGFLFSLGLKSYPILKPKTHGSPTPSRAEDVATVTDISISNNTLNERRSSSIVVNVLPPKETITN
jgi:hypothetical protein